MKINTLATKQILVSGLAIAKTVIVEGTLSLVNQKVREVSRTNYIGVKENSRQIRNLTKNIVDGTDPDDWDYI